MKIKESRLKELIREESIKFKKRAVLESEKAEILKKLNEGGEIEEGWFDKTADELEAKGLPIVMKHPAKKKTYEATKAVNPEKAALYLQFFGANPSVNYAKWDDNKKKWVDSTIYQAGIGPSSASGHLEETK